MSDMLPRKREVTITLWVDPTLEAEKEALENITGQLAQFANAEWSVREEKSEEEMKVQSQRELKKMGLL